MLNLKLLPIGAFSYTPPILDSELVESGALDSTQIVRDDEQIRGNSLLPKRCQVLLRTKIPRTFARQF